MTLRERIAELGLTVDDPIMAVGEGMIISAPISYFSKIQSLLDMRVVREDMDSEERRHIFMVV